MKFAEDGVTVVQILECHGYLPEEDGVHWVYRGERGDSRLAVGRLEGLLREAGSRKLSLYVQQQKDLCKG